MREYQLDQQHPIEQQWIQNVTILPSNPETNIEQYFIIYFIYDQALAFQDAQIIQIDMSFKMVAGDTWLFTIIKWLSEANSKSNYF